MRPAGRAVSWQTAAVSVFVLLELLAVLALTLISAARDRAVRPSLEINLRLVRELKLNDLALSPGTGYTRHPSQAEFFAAHGEHPSAIERSPAGSILQPPTGMRSPVPAIPPGAPP